MQRSGTDLLVESRKTCAIVADLIAEPKLDTHAEIIALRSVLATLDRSGARPGGSARRPLAAELIGADGDLRAETVDAVVDIVAGRIGLSLVETDEGSADGAASSSPPSEPWRPRARLVAGLAVGLLLVVGGVAGWLAFVDPAGRSNDGDESDRTDGVASPAANESQGNDAPLDSTTAGGDGDASELAEGADQRSISAVFEPVREGPFEVTRSWRVPGGGEELIGLILVSRVESGGGAQRLHNELIPRLAVDEAVFDNVALLVWTPQPLAAVGLGARFDAGRLAEGESLEIQFRAPLRDGQPVDEAEVFAWFAAWEVDFASLRPLGESEFDELVEPSVEQG